MRSATWSTPAFQTGPTWRLVWKLSLMMKICSQKCFWNYEARNKPSSCLIFIFRSTTVSLNVFHEFTMIYGMSSCFTLKIIMFSVLCLCLYSGLQCCFFSPLNQMFYGYDSSHSWLVWFQAGVIAWKIHFRKWAVTVELHYCVMLFVWLAQAKCKNNKPPSLLWKKKSGTYSL